MGAAGFGRLSAAQRARVDEWMPAAEVVADLSWNQVETIVLRVRQGDAEFVVKAAGPDVRHFGRELDAHLGGLLSVWAGAGRAPVLRHHDREARVLVTAWLPGELAYRTPWGIDPGVHRRAGSLLREFHAQAVRPSEGTDAAATARALAWLDAPHAVAPAVEARLRDALAALGPIEADLVPTHGDWQPRNWLVDGDAVRVIDFGRFAFRPAASDFVRLSAQEWRAEPACEAAFFDGYGADPRHPDHWLLMRLREAIGTACWAHQVGDVAFEAQGHRMIADALAEFDDR
ncbi:phosphotransferase [Microbacterium kyungheense]|uniref:Phosphotransferase family enzyme n=1 Tax=Microbacterium kyungheense TaxID=1263636 RepID=A0A543FLF5_9MICO|nr:phosphotransferase [Microbacterium kyungheense]TQM34681.1 phosphotransferase family enzyme [Microbacterium kyungheense]